MVKYFLACTLKGLFLSLLCISFFVIIHVFSLKSSTLKLYLPFFLFLALSSLRSLVWCHWAMVRKKGSLILCGAFLFVAWNALLLLFLWGRPPIGRLGEGGGAEPGAGEEWGAGKAKVGGANGLAGEVIRLAEEVESELETQKKLLKQIQSHRELWEQRKELEKRESEDTKDEKIDAEPKMPQQILPVHLSHKVVEDAKTVTKKMQTVMVTPPQLVIKEQEMDQENKQMAEDQVGLTTPSPQIIIPILVIACDRVTVKRSLDRLIQYRPSAELYPIIVSQDCGHADTARVIGSYGSQITHVSQPDLADIPVRPDHRKFQGYYKIARHYRWALNQVFNVFAYSTVVIVEDDLEVR